MDYGLFAVKGRVFEKIIERQVEVVMNLEHHLEHSNYSGKGVFALAPRDQGGLGAAVAAEEDAEPGPGEADRAEGDNQAAGEERRVMVEYFLFFHISYDLYVLSLRWFMS